MNWYLTY